MDSPLINDTPNLSLLNDSVDYVTSNTDINASFEHPRNDEIISNQSTPSQANSSISSISKIVSPAMSTPFLKPSDLNIPSMGSVVDSPSTPQFSSPIATPLIKAKHMSVLSSYNAQPSPPTPTMSSPLLTTPPFPNMKSRSVVAPRFKTTVSSPYSTTSSTSSMVSSSSSLPPLVPVTDLSIPATPPSIDNLLGSPIKTTLLKTPMDHKYGHHNNMTNVSLSLDTPPKLISSPPLTTPLLPRGASHAVAISSFSALAADVDLKGQSSRRSSLTNSPSRFNIDIQRVDEPSTPSGPSNNDTVASLNSSIAEDPRTLSHNTTVDPDQDFDAINSSVSQQVNAIAVEQAAIAAEYEECTEEDRIRAEICGDENAAEIVNRSMHQEYVISEDVHNRSVHEILNESVHYNSDASSESESVRSISVNSSYEAPQVEFSELSHIQRNVLEVFKARPHRNTSSQDAFAKYIRSLAPAFTLDQVRLFLATTEESDIKAAVEFLESSKYLERFERDNAVYYREQFDRSVRQAIMASH